MGTNMCLLATTVFVLIIVPLTQTYEIKVGIVMAIKPDYGANEFAFPISAGAIPAAIEQIEAEQLLPGATFT
jgi:hypothetical protein